MDIQKKQEISRRLNVNYGSLLLKAKTELMKTGITMIKCPNCNERPRLLNNDEFGFRMKCNCGYMNMDERY